MSKRTNTLFARFGLLVLCGVVMFYGSERIVQEGGNHWHIGVFCAVVAFLWSLVDRGYGHE